MVVQQDITDFLEQILLRARSLGVAEAEVVYNASDSNGIDYADGALENATIAQNAQVGIRLIQNQRQGFASFMLPSNQPLEHWVDTLFARLAVLPEDATCGLASKEQLHTGERYCDVRDTVRWSRAEMTAMAAELWQRVMDSKNIDGSSGATVQQVMSHTVILNSAGFLGTYQESRYHRSVSAIAGIAPHMEEDYVGESRLYAENISSLESMSDEASMRAAARVDPKSVPSGLTEVIFEPRIAMRLVGQILAAINGGQVLRGATFLGEKLGESIAHKEFSITDDPFSPRCFSAAPFDTEGLSKQVHNHIKFGKLQKFVLDLATSRGLGLSAQGQGIRAGVATPPAPSVSHAIVANGAQSVETMIAGIDQGLWITEMIGRGLDSITGQFSCGVAGFRIEKGQRTTPFRNVTIAGDGSEILRNLCPANDQKTIGAMEVPSLYLGVLTAGG